MIYNGFQDLTLSQLGFGAMRLPTLPDGSIDEKQVYEMVDTAIEQGVNYFDTAYPYHGGLSELVMGRALARHPRESFYLATKFPGHQLSDHYDPAAVFEDQLKKCGVDHFDFYLMHNVYENSLPVYTDPRWGIVDYFIEQKKRGRIRHLGFSTHGSLDVIRAFLDYCGGAMEFCQIQLNYLDWTLQNARAKVELLNERHIPIWVMEPVRGGRLAKLADADEKKLAALRPDESVAAWAFRYLQDIAGVSVILSGMSNRAQLNDNLKTFAAPRPLSPEERALLEAIAEGIKNSVPCTGCRYCTAGCPMNLDIPLFLSIYNELRFSPSVNATMRIECLPEDRQPAACVGCGQCAAVCPQKIAIPDLLSDLAERMKSMPTWAQISRERAEAQKKLAAERAQG